MWKKRRNMGPLSLIAERTQKLRDKVSAKGERPSMSNPFLLPFNQGGSSLHSHYATREEGRRHFLGKTGASVGHTGISEEGRGGEGSNMGR